MAGVFDLEISDQNHNGIAETRIDGNDDDEAADEGDLVDLDVRIKYA